MSGICTHAHWLSFLKGLSVAAGLAGDKASSSTSGRRTPGRCRRLRGTGLDRRAVARDGDRSVAAVQIIVRARVRFGVGTGQRQSAVVSMATKTAPASPAFAVGAPNAMMEPSADMPTFAPAPKVTPFLCGGGKDTANPTLSCSTPQPYLDSWSPKEAPGSHRAQLWGLGRQSSVRLHALHDLPDESPNRLGTLDADSDDRIRRHAAFVHAGSHVRHQGQSQYLSTHLSSDDGLQRARHSHQVGTQCPEHTNFSQESRTAARGPGRTLLRVGRARRLWPTS